MKLFRSLRGFKVCRKDERGKEGLFNEKCFPPMFVVAFPFLSFSLHRTAHVSLWLLLQYLQGTERADSGYLVP